MKKSLKNVIQKKDWVLLAALVVAIVALVLLITPKEETIDTITVIPPPSQDEAMSADISSELAPVAAITATDLTNVRMEDRIAALQQPTTAVSAEAMALPSPQVPFADPNLAAALNTQLGRPVGTAITEADLTALLDSIGASNTTGPLNTPVKLLQLNSKSITSLAGLEKLVAPTGFKIALNLEDNRITDLTPLSNLTDIVYLNINRNMVADLRPIAALTALEELYIQGNQISDIGVVAGMVNLHSLNAENNLIVNADGLRPHYMTYLAMANNRLGRLIMDQYMASPSTYPLPTTLTLSGNLININDPRDFSVGLRSGGAELWPQYKMDLFDANGALVMYNVEMGSDEMSFRLMRRATSDGVTFGLPELIPNAQIVPAYPRDSSGKEEKHRVEFTFDPITGVLSATPKSYGKQMVTFYLWGVDGSFTRVTVEFNVLMSK